MCIFRNVKAFTFFTEILSSRNFLVKKADIWKLELVLKIERKFHTIYFSEVVSNKILFLGK